MCSTSCIQFGESVLSKNDVKDKNVIEVGAINVNGSLREYVQKLGTNTYLGVDITFGLGVDEICDIYDLTARYGENSFDLVICTEVLEHVRYWRRAVSNLKNILKPGGILIVTTRSKGFGYHSWPSDFWRYELEDMISIFNDLLIDNVKKDPQDPGVFIRARKPALFKENELITYKLYSIISERKRKSINEFDLIYFKIKTIIKKIFRKIKRIITEN